MAEQPNLLSEQIPIIEKKKLWQKQEFCFALLLLVGIAVLFYKTILLGVPISRLDLITELDTLYNSALKGTALTVSEDPSVCLQSYPKEWFLINCLQNWQAPLWNGLSGCGQPILADLANCLLHPINFLFGVKNQALYNIGLVVKIALPALIAYFLFLKRGAVPWAAASAALGYALYARSLRVAELANTSMAPLVFLAFDLLPYKFERKSAVRSGAMIGLAYYYMHPESFFITILSALTLWILEGNRRSNISEQTQTTSYSSRAYSSSSSGDNSTGDYSSSDGPNRLSNGRASLSDGLSSIFWTGLIAIGFAAPTLFAFLEFLPNGHSYKFSDTYGQFIPLDQVFLFISSPRVSENLFPGLIVLAAIPAGTYQAIRQAPATVILFLFWFFFQCRPFPLNQILMIPPVSYILPEYCISILMLILCLWSSWGLTYLSQEKWRSMRWLALAATALALCLLPLICALFPRADGLVFQLSSKAATTTILISISCIIMLALMKKDNRWTKSLAFILPILNLVTLWAPAHAELPARTKIAIPPAGRAELIDTIASFPGERFTACGDRILLPNTCLLYGLSDLRTGTPINSALYLKFMEAAGAKLGYCNTMQIPFELNKLYDMASVRLILTSAPIGFLDSQGDHSARTVHSVSKSGRIIPGLRLLPSAITYYPESAELLAELNFRMHLSVPNRHQFQLALANKEGKELWQGDFVFLQPFERSASKEIQKRIHIPVPVKAEEKLNLTLKIIDGWSGQALIPDGIEFSKTSLIELAAFKPEQNKLIESQDHRFRLLYESPDSLRVYLNRNALPEAYLVRRVLNKESAEAALSAIQAPDFDPHSTVVLHEANSFAGALDATLPKADSVRILNRSNTSITLSCKSSSKAILVLTDLFYPGWNAYVDDRQRRIYQANYMFRAIEVDRGEHIVVVRYEPLPLFIGLFFLLLTALFSLRTCLLKK